MLPVIVVFNTFLSYFLCHKNDDILALTGVAL